MILDCNKFRILMSLLYHNDTIIKKEKELLRALLIQFCKLEVVSCLELLLHFHLKDRLHKPFLSAMDHFPLHHH